jgi:hypothetical protein
MQCSFSAQSVLDAIHALFDWDPRIVQAANNYLMGWNGSKCAEAIAFELLAGSPDHQIQHFCAIILFNRIKSGWLTFAHHFQLALKSFLVNAFRDCTFSADVADHLVHAIAMIAMHDVPHRWPDFFSIFDARSDRLSRIFVKLGMRLKTIHRLDVRWKTALEFWRGIVESDEP